MSLPGKLLLYLYHRPVNTARDSIRHGGPLAQWRTARGRAEMRRAAAGLGPLPEVGGEPVLRVHVMTGRKFWYQTAFCLHSLARAARCTVEAELYDDGTLDANLGSALRRLGPGVRLRPWPELMERLEALLPAARFPVLRERWDHYPNIRKLIAVHLGETGWKLSLDSDMLFFHRPDLLVDAARRTDTAVHAIDFQESYGYSRPLLERLAGAPLPARVNVGVWALPAERLRWDELEAWCAELIAREKTHYYLEQALIAMLLAREPRVVALPRDDYLVFPGRAEVVHPRAALHHYVAESKRWYFQIGWRHLAPPP